MTKKRSGLGETRSGVVGQDEIRQDNTRQHRTRQGDDDRRKKKAGVVVHSSIPEKRRESREIVDEYRVGKPENDFAVEEQSPASIVAVRGEKQYVSRMRNVTDKKGQVPSLTDRRERTN